MKSKAGSEIWGQLSIGTQNLVKQGGEGQNCLTYVYMVYTAESISLAAFEMIVHLPQEALFYNLYVRIHVEFDAKQVITLKRSNFPKNWQNNPPGEATQKIGSTGKEIQSNVTDNQSAKMATSHGVLGTGCTGEWTRWSGRSGTDRWLGG
jgi:hypothetical protein